MHGALPQPRAIAVQYRKSLSRQKPDHRTAWPVLNFLISERDLKRILASVLQTIARRAAEAALCLQPSAAGLVRKWCRKCRIYNCLTHPEVLMPRCHTLLVDQNVYICTLLYDMVYMPRM